MVLTKVLIAYMCRQYMYNTAQHAYTGCPRRNV